MKYVKFPFKEGLNRCWTVEIARRGLPTVGRRSLFYSISTVFLYRLIFQCGLIFRRCVSSQLFERFVKRASMRKKAAQRQRINGM